MNTAKHLTLKNIVGFVGGLALFPILLAVIIMVWYIISHMGRYILVVEQGVYKVKVVYYPSGLGTNQYVKLYSVKKGVDEQLLVFADARDSAGIEFLDSTTAQILILQKRSDLEFGAYWQITDSFVLDLSKSIETIFIE